MIRLKNLQFSESINQQKLVFDEGWFNKLHRIFVYLFFCVWGVLPFLIYFDPHRNYSQKGIEYYLVFFFTIFCAYVIYRKASEKKLNKLSSYLGFAYQIQQENVHISKVKVCLLPTITA